MRSRRERLVKLARQSIEGRSIDWEETQRRQPDLAPALFRLRQLEALTPARLDAGAVAPRTQERRTPLLHWGAIRVLEKIGEGRFAEVFRAWDPMLEREVALKLSRSDRRLHPWLEEARHLARVRHPNVLMVYGADTRDERPGIWTEFVAGPTLEAILQTRRRLRAQEAARIGRDLCGALSAVHAAGLVHGDLKASNVVRETRHGGDPSRGRERIVLLDFGAAIACSPPGVHSAAFGTPLALAPEILRGAQPSPASDIYALGVLLYRLVSGRYPVQSCALPELAARVQRGPSIPLRELRRSLWDFVPSFVASVERALDPEPHRRFANAIEMREALLRT
jgi:serine/threonine protein kinase